MTATSNAADAFFGTVTLSDLGLIRASGSDAASFLHGQLTQDIETLAEGEARLAGYCSAKGRLLASFIVWRSGPEEILLACSADVLPATLKRLSMFVLRTKCKLTDASAELQLWGLAGPPATQWLGSAAPSSPWRTASAGAGHAVRLSDVNGLGRYLWCAPRGLPAPELPVLAEQAWAWLEVHSGIARITSGTTERFVPQMVNFELVAGVNFRKGCYPGQEIVARSQYRGTIKRRSFLFEADAPASPGQEVFQENDDPSQPAGMVVNAASFDGRHAALVEVKLAAPEGTDLRLGSPGGAMLRRLALPYDVPVEDAA